MRLIFALLFSLVSGIALAWQNSGTGSPDPYVLGTSPLCGDWMCNAIYTDTTGKSARNLSINTGIRNLVLIIAGQSLRMAEAPTAYTLTNGAAIDNFNISDGSIYTWSDPPLGSTYSNSTSDFGPGHIGGRIADKLINAGSFDRVIIVPAAIGATSVAQWATGALANNLCIVMKRLAARGITPQTNVTFAIEWGQGETDQGLGTSQSAYATSLSTVISNVQACGFSGRFFVAEETWNVGAISAAIEAAQVGVVNGTTIFASGNIDSLNASNRLTDNTHLNDTGMAAAATLIYNAIHASGAPF